MAEKQKLQTIDEYIATLTAESRLIIMEIRRLMKVNFPAATETISYQMPAFKLKKNFFYFAGFKKHIGIYPPMRGDEELLEELRPYQGEKGNLKFPLNQPIPYELILRVAGALAQEHGGI